MRRKAFSLIELLVVVSVIGIMSALLLPAIQKAKEKAKSAICANNLRQIGYAFKMYAEDNEGYYAYNDFEGENNRGSTTYASKLIPYICNSGWNSFWESHLDHKQFKLFVCPSWREGESPAESSRNPPRDYASNYALTTLLISAEQFPKKENFREDERDNIEVNALVLEGEARRLIPDYNCSYIYKRNGVKYRHNRTSNILMRDGSVEITK